MNLLPLRRELPTFARLQDQLNRMFDGFAFADESNGAADTFVPALDLADTPEALVVKLEVPGVDAKDINVSVQENVLTISGEKKSEKKEEHKNWYRRETSYGRFSRALTLPAVVDANRVEATTAAGVLTVRLPKSETAKPRQITAKSSS